MDSLTLVAIALAVLAVVVTVIMLRRRQDSSFGRMPLPLDDNAFTTPPARRNSVAISSADLAAISALVAGNNKIEAIKRVRELTGLGLKEAKDYVEAMPLTAQPDLPAPAPPPIVHTNLAAPDLAEVSVLMASGNKIEAIKRLRELTGLGLKEAKDYVESMPAAGPLPVLPRTGFAPPAGAGDLAEVHALAQQGHKIEAIKRYRQLTGVGLKEAKDYVDRL
jgi:ribosomal protein L7/L12